jgi:hypothetical protein
VLKAVRRASLAGGLQIVIGEEGEGVPVIPDCILVVLKGNLGRAAGKDVGEA